MRWLFLILTLLCAGTAFNTDNPALMGVCLLLMLVFAFIAVLAFAQARIEASAQSQVSVLGGREVQELRRQTLQKRVATQTASRNSANGTVGSGYSGDFGNAPSKGPQGGRGHDGDFASTDGGNGSD